MNDFIIKKRIITEKSLKDAAKNWYTFSVSLKADKRAIKKEIERQFAVDVLSIKTIIRKGKTKSIGKKRQQISLSPIKKALVRIKDGQKIEDFETGGKK